MIDLIFLNRKSLRKKPKNHEILDAIGQFQAFYCIASMQ